MSPEPGEEAPTGADPARVVWHCYRHPGRESGVRCSRCERPICPDCMITAPVGFQCRECVKGAPAVRTVRSLRVEPYVTYALVAASVLAFLPTLAGGAAVGRSGNTLAVDYALFGPAVAAGEWWRLFTSGFLHYGLLHLGFNMFILYQLGQMLEPVLGRLRFAVLYVTALLTGSVGVLLLDPTSLTAGASGAVFGLMGAAVVASRFRGIDPMQSGIGGLLLVNLLLTFLIPRISIGGHIGGLIGGLAGGALLFAAGDRDRGRVLAGALACAGLAAVAAAAGLYLASNPV